MAVKGPLTIWLVIPSFLCALGHRFDTLPWSCCFVSPRPTKTVGGATVRGLGELPLVHSPSERKRETSPILAQVLHLCLEGL